jgi:hypothetical protein
VYHGGRAAAYGRRAHWNCTGGTLAIVSSAVPRVNYATTPSVFFYSILEKKLFHFYNCFLYF